MKINRLKLVLVEKSKTGKWLAKQLGKSESTVSRWCINEIQPSIDTFVEIAEILNIDIKELINSTKN
ncbi:helix-turn-helix transcriptional regulator [Elizabethkingia anophelis]|uniref:helix-turn-helix transcriptional regulator n=1 Tax=Elizabethkingia anophelis TaxID=1117645 RepID=UPI0038916931